MRKAYVDKTHMYGGTTKFIHKEIRLLDEL